MGEASRMSRPASRREAGVSDLLPWIAMAMPGVAILKDGSLLCGYHYAGRDITSMSPHDRNAVALTLSQALQTLGDGWSAHLDAIRLATDAYPSERQWPDQATAIIEAERREAFGATDAAFTTTCAMAMRWRPPKRLKRGIERFTRFIAHEEEEVAQTLDDALASFEERLSGFEDVLGHRLAMHRMRLGSSPEGRTYDELTTHLRWMLTGEAVALSSRQPMHLDAQMNCGDLQAGRGLRLGEEWIAVVSLDDLPDATVPDILRELQSMPFPCRWHARFIAFDEAGARREINAIRVKWSQQTRNWLDKLAHPQPVATSVINRDAATMAADAEEQLSALSSGRIGFGRATWCIVIRHPERAVLRERARLARQTLQQLGFPGRIETTNALEAFLGSLPGNVFENVRAPLVDTQTFAHMSPLSTTWTGPSTCPSKMVEGGNGPPLVLCRTEGTTPFRFSLHVDDLGHTLMFGATGSGKSTLLGLLCAQWMRYRNARVIIIDKDRSLETLTHAVGGVHHTLDPDSQSASFAPFARLNGRSERAWAADWIRGLCDVQNVKLQQQDLRDINEAINDLSRRKSEHTVTDMAYAMQNSTVKQALEPYATGVYANLFNGSRDAIGDERWLCVELAAVMSADVKLQLPALSHLFGLIDRQAKEQGDPTLLVIDEAWAALGHAAFRERLRDWLKTFRKKNVAVVLGTQSLSDVSRSGMLDVIAEACATRIFGANGEAMLSAELYQALGLSADQTEIIANLAPKREYFIAQRGEGARVVDFSLGPKTLALCGVSSDDDLNRASELRESQGDAWLDAWLEERTHANGR